MKRLSPVEVARRFVASHIVAGDHCIDATLGNGHDTLFLAQGVGNSGKVLGFDVQSSAVESARHRIREAGLSDRVDFRNQGHETMVSVIKSISWSGVKLIMFNLGYLPGSDKSVITTTSTTIMALDASINVLAADGAISIVAYRGHVGGAEEYDAVINWVNRLSHVSYFVVRYECWTDQRGSTPVFFWIKRR